MSAQFIKNAEGETEYVVLSVAEYENLTGLKEDDWQDLGCAPSSDDDSGIPHEVVGIKIKEGVSLLAAWRIYREMTQSDVESKTDISQASLSQMEQIGKQPQLRTRKKLAKIYNCDPDQLME